MASYNDLTTVVNSVVEQALGKDAVASVSLDNIASLGDLVITSSSDGSNDIVFKTLIDRIGKTVTDVRQYTGKYYFLFKSAFEYGCILQKLHVDNFTAKTSDVYDITNGETDSDLFKISLPSVHQALFENQKPWEFMVTITDKQIKSAFTSPETLTAFINGIYTAMANSIEKYMETMGRMVIERMIVEKINDQVTADTASETALYAVNLLQEYYNETGTTLTTTSCLYNADFLRWCTSIFLDYKKLFADMTTLFNTEGYERHTPEGSLAFLINGKFADNVKRYMTSDVFNKELVEMPVYNEVNYWQGLGKSASITDRMKVKASLTISGTEVEINKLVVGIMYDVDAMGTTVLERDTVVIPNEHKHCRNLFEQGMVGNYIDKSENALVFYIDSVTEGE